jgi:hypothetical protein
LEIIEIVVYSGWVSIGKYLVSRMRCRACALVASKLVAPSILQPHPPLGSLPARSYSFVTPDHKPLGHAECARIRWPSSAILRITVPQRVSGPLSGFQHKHRHKRSELGPEGQVLTASLTSSTDAHVAVAGVATLPCFEINS